MTSSTDSVRTQPGRAPDDPDLRTWDPSRGIFMPAERRTKRLDKTALCVQITLCIVVAALLFSAIAVPKLRNPARGLDPDQPLPPAIGGR